MHGFQADADGAPLLDFEGFGRQKFFGRQDLPDRPGRHLRSLFVEKLEHVGRTARRDELPAVALERQAAQSARLGVDADDKMLIDHEIPGNGQGAVSRMRPGVRPPAERRVAQRRHALGQKDHFSFFGRTRCDLAGNHPAPAVADFGPFVSGQRKHDRRDVRALPRTGIEDDNELAPDVPGVDMSGKNFQGFPQGRPPGRKDAVGYGQGLVVGGPDGRTGQDVVELVEAGPLPTRIEDEPGIGRLIGQGQRGESLERRKQILALPVAEFDIGMGRIAALEYKLKFVADDGKFMAFRLDRREVGFGRREPEIRKNRG